MSFHALHVRLGGRGVGVGVGGATALDLRQNTESKNWVPYRETVISNSGET